MITRRLFIGDLHGCVDELNRLLDKFRFTPGEDQLFSVGDVVGKGPSPRKTLKRLKELGTTAVKGNHDHEFLEYSNRPLKKLSGRERDTVKDLGPERDYWVEEISSWPYFVELEDIILVHGGLVPGLDPSDTDPFLLMNIRTWDGSGKDLKSKDNPPWFERVYLSKTVIFGHWAKRGLVNLPRFKGLDTGCVYGKKLTGYCPEEDRFYSVASKKAYVKVN